MPDNSSTDDRTIIVLPGRSITKTPAAEPAQDQFLKVERLAATVVDATVRGGADEQTVYDQGVEPGDVVELEFRNGTRQWYAVKQLPDILADLQEAQGQRSRSEAAREMAASNRLEIPTVWARGTATRGFGESLTRLGINFVSLLRPDPQEELKGLIADQGPELAAKLIAAHFEKKLEGQLNPAGEGLYRFGSPQVLDQSPLAAKDLNNTAPYLLFIHGTASSSVGSFSRLGIRHSFDILRIETTPEWATLQSRYGDRVVAYEHRTLSRSPLENALQLAETLPDGAKLHLVTHSRGGLVGELLCLSQVKELNRAGALKAFLERLAVPFDKNTRGADIATLQGLIEIVSRKQFQIERFVRVACPARGTKLASQRFNDFFSTILDLFKYLPWLQANPLVDFVRSTFLALLKYPTDPQKLPGIEAQMPEAPLIKMLNGLNLTTESDLAVIEGDIQPGELADRLKFSALEGLFREDNDLVVNTRAMTGGMKRAQGIFKLNDRGQEVSHFSYFNNHKTRTGLFRWLTLEKTGAERATEANFEAVRPETERDAVARGTRGAAAENPPVLFVLPGLMGSHLSARGERVWLNQYALAQGGLARLAQGAPQVAPESLLTTVYGNLLEYLQAKYEVIPFPYDWRLSLRESADALKKAVKAELEKASKAELEKQQRPVRFLFLAHGAGGLVVLAMLAADEELKEKLKARDYRLVMLGTPQRGTYLIPQLLAGQGQLINMLNMIDLRPTPDDPVRILSQYQGLLELLPDDFINKAKRAEKWRLLSGVERPADAQLDAAAQLRAELIKAVDKRRMRYVAGSATGTPNDIEVDKADKDADPGLVGISEGDEIPKLAAPPPAFLGTTEGDGQVTYESGLLDQERTWYVDAAHGDLPAQKEIFPALVDLLERGTTNNLPTSPGATRGLAVSGQRLLSAEPPQIFPDDQDLAAAALGKRVKAAPRTNVHQLKISVLHTDLRNAHYPIAVGHYKDDLIIGAERVIDRALNGRLTQLLQVGLYPGAEGTAEVVRVKDADVKGADIEGALIVGLGEYGQATRDKVRNGVTIAALRYAMRVLNDGDPPGKQGWRSASFTSLLLGTYSSAAMSVTDAVSAILQGALQANRLLRRQGLWDEVRIDEIEITELYEDVATQAAHAARYLTAAPPINLEPDEALLFEPAYLQEDEGGRPQRPLHQYAAGWVHRLKIAVEKHEDEPPAARDDAEKRLIFTMLTERARLEEKVVPSQGKLIKHFIGKAIRSADNTRKLGATLFDLLIPNSFKDLFGAEGDWLLLVDNESAQYPWELMAQRTRGLLTPLTADRGLIRQLVTEDFRVQPQSAQGNNVLIIGDPKLDNPNFQQLPGAVSEAKAVKAQFEGAAGKDFAVTALIGAEAPEIIHQLFEKDYRIIHLAGHGFYDDDEKHHAARSGMVLGDGIWLTAAEIQQLTVVPDLVFINCCFLGSIDREPRANRLAASIALELIRMGVRVVIAGGWAIDDDAAKTFAEVFYQKMLSNHTFGAAVKEARRAVKYDDSNTWGAYQCYGSPDFRLYRRGSSQSYISERQLLSPREYRNELRQIAADSKNLDTQAAQRTRERLEDLYKSLPAPQWLDAEMLAAFGGAWQALGETDESVRFYSRALSDEAGNLTLKDIQALANLSGRQAAAVRSEAASTRLKELLHEEWRLLVKLKRLSRTSEMLSLFGSHFKRRARLEDDQEIRRNLQRAAEYYEDAFLLARNSGRPLNPYPTLNWVTCKALLRLFPAPSSAGQEPDDWHAVEQVLCEVAQVAEGMQDAGKLWARLHRPDAMLLQYLLDLLKEPARLSDKEPAPLSHKDTQRRIVEAYQRATKDRIGRTELGSVLGQISFVIALLKRVPGQAPEQQVALAALTDIQEGISDAITR